MATTTPEIDRDELLRVIRTGAPIRSIGKMRALALLSSGEVSDASGFLSDLVVDQRLEPRFRIAAATGLYRSERRAPAQMLSEMAAHADEWTAAPIAVGLARVGGADREPLIKKLERIVSPHLRNRVTFAQTLLEYRHGLPTGSVRTPTPQQMQDVEGTTSAIEIGTTVQREVKAAFEALSRDPLDVDLVPDRAQRVECGPNTFVWLWDRGALASGARPGANTVGGVLTRQGRLRRGHSLSRIALLTPRRASTAITIHRALTGEIEYSGSISPQGSFTLRTVKSPGLAAVEIEGRISDRVLAVDAAVSTSTTRAARIPAAG
ncbi:MAG: hypothetical protein WBG57_03155 [Ornithinimicrobium sp.]